MDLPHEKAFLHFIILNCNSDDTMKYRIACYTDYCKSRDMKE